MRLKIVETPSEVNGKKGRSARMLNKYGPGRIETVEIKTVWPKEENFSDWLAGPDGLDLLGDAIDMELDIDTELGLDPPGREFPVGPYSADLVCRDTADNKRVVIENEFGKGDHDHLGKLLTYASVLKADVVIWIAETIGDEHRAALDWLNEHTDEGTEFFGFEIKVLKIGNSEPAPQFHAVARPNELVRDAAATGHKTRARIFYHEYWTKLKEYMELYGRVKMRKPLSENWATFSVGKSFAHIEAKISVTKNSGRVFLHVSKEGMDGHQIMEYIRDQHGKDFSKNFGGDVEYNYVKGGRRTAQVILMNEKVNANNVNEWNEQHKWLSETIDTFDRVFRPIVAEINPNDFRRDGNAEDNDDGEE